MNADSDLRPETLAHYGLTSDAELPPETKFLLKTRELVQEGKSIYGDPNSARAQEKLAELNARLELGHRIGTVPAAKPWTADRIATETLAKEFPVAPSLELAEHAAAFLGGQLDCVAPTPATVAEVEADFKERATRATMNIIRHNKTGRQIVDELMAYAAPVVRTLATKIGKDADKALEQLRGNRDLLEQFAQRGMLHSAYVARKTQLGVK